MISRLLAHVRRNHTTAAAYTALILAIGGGGGYAVAATVTSTPTITGRWLAPYPSQQHNLKITRHGQPGEYQVQVTACGKVGSEIVASPYGFVPGSPPSLTVLYGGKTNLFRVYVLSNTTGMVTDIAKQGFTIVGECN